MKPPLVNNLFAKTSAASSEETFSSLLSHRSFEFEQIVSHGAASPEDFWYEQERNEWVMLARGEAALRFDEETVDLKAGDYLLIPAGRRHRVEQTSPDAVWLALHFRE